MVHLHQLVDLLPHVGEQRLLPGHALLNVGEDEEGGALLPGDEGLVADLGHQSLDDLHVGLALVHAAGDALEVSGQKSRSFRIRRFQLWWMVIGGRHRGR